MTVQLCLMMMMDDDDGWDFLVPAFLWCCSIISTPHPLLSPGQRIKGSKCWTPDGRLKFSWLMHQCCLFPLRTEYLGPFAAELTSWTPSNLSVVIFVLPAPVLMRSWMLEFNSPPISHSCFLLLMHAFMSTSGTTPIPQKNIGLC